MKRRIFLQYISAIGGSTLVSQILQSGCKSSDKTEDQSDPCSDLSRLTEEEKETRKELEYVSKSPYLDKLCDNCQLWIEPKEGSQCGGCEVMEGPVHPKGYCSVWAAIE